MRTLVVWAAVAAAVVAGLEALVVILGSHVPVWSLVALPIAAGCVAFLLAGRRRAVRLQRERRAGSGRPRRPEAAETGEIRRVLPDARDHVLVPLRADDGAGGR